MARHIHIHLQDVLESGPSEGAFQHNVKAEIAAGKPAKQAVAIAYAKKREGRDSAEVTAADYEQLADELLAFIEQQEAKTRDDWKEEEHPRQPDGKFGQGGGAGGAKADKPGLGPKPTSTTAKVAKHAVHELLSSGHPWTIEELAKITGHANKTSLSSWISMFKNAKTAGPKGQLSIVKLPGGQYQVVKADGNPAPAVEVPKQQEPAPKPAPKPVPPPAPVPQAAPAAAAPPPVAFGPSKVALPKSTVGVSADDFQAGPTGETKFGERRKKLMAEMLRDGGTPQKMKSEVEAGLAKALEKSQAFQKLKQAAVAYGIPSIERSLVASWASSSGNGNNVSCAMQLAVRDAFDLKDTEVGGMDLLREGPNSEQKIWTTVANRFKFDASTPEKMEVLKEAFRDFAKAQYQQTQDWFKKRGITEISVVRGMKTPGPADPKVVSMGLQPASSFSADIGTAIKFCGPASTTMLSATIPVSHVLSHYRTGWGCANEHEVVVLGDRSLTAVHSQAGKSTTPKGLADQGRAAFGQRSGATQFSPSGKAVLPKPVTA